jgi:hypothetical protein
MALVTEAFTKPEEISDWAQRDDGTVCLQCARMAFTPIRFMMNTRVIDSWQQVSANTKHREKLASLLFGERVVLKRQLFDDGHVLVYEMTSFANPFGKPVDNRIKTRQMTFPGAPKRMRMPV